jgi:hypothetical protein
VTPATDQPRAWHLPDAGVLRLESRTAVALVRTGKGPRNTQYGGAIGGASLVYLGDRESGRDRLRLDRESPLVEGGFTLYPARPARRAALLRWRRSDPPGREGRQWLFVARLLLAQGRPVAAFSRIGRGYLRPLLQSLADPIATHWALGAEVHLDALVGGLRVAGQPARPDGSVPSWAAGMTLTREYALQDAGLRVVDRLAQEVGTAGGGPACARIVYLVPAAAQEVRVASSEPVARRGPAGRRVELRPSGATFSLRLSYTVIV